MKISKLVTSLLLLLSVACNDEVTKKTTISPDDINELTQVLEFDATGINGEMPEGTSETLVVKAPTGISGTSDNFFFIPLAISGEAGFDGIYLQFSNRKEQISSNYFDFDFTGSAAGTLMIPVKVPENIEGGEFYIHVSAYNDEGDVSEAKKFPVEIAWPLKGCEGAGLVARSGEIQSLARTYSFDESYFGIDKDTKEIIPQTLRFYSEKYETPDRIDFYIDKQWVGGTGSTLAYGVAPSAYECTDENAGDGGFISGYHSFEFTIKPNQRIDVFVSACLDNSAWDYWFACPKVPEEEEDSN